MMYRDLLIKFLGNSEERRVAILGIGNPLRGDDAVGLVILEDLEDMGLGENFLLLRTETVPESFTGEIREFQPSHILLMDAANFGGEPGEARIIPQHLIKGQTVSTHNMPLNIFTEFIRKSITPNVILLGIQIVKAGFQEDMTPQVEESAHRIAETLFEIFTEK
jgi:hydrogenase 3 maturation protease